MNLIFKMFLFTKAFKIGHILYIFLSGSISCYQVTCYIYLFHLYLSCINRFGKISRIPPGAAPFQLTAYETAVNQSIIYVQVMA